MDFEILKFEKIDSTNKFAYELGKSGKRNIIIVSDVQTQGKGRIVITSYSIHYTKLYEALLEGFHSDAIYWKLGLALALHL